MRNAGATEGAWSPEREVSTPWPNAMIAAVRQANHFTATERAARSRQAVA